MQQKIQKRVGLFNPRDSHKATPPDYAVDSERRQAFVKFSRKLSAGEIERYVTWLLANPSFQADFSEIVDLTEVEEVDLQASDFIKLADQVDPFSPGAKRAFVVQNSMQAHAARMHKILRPEATIGIFHSFEEAEQWIHEPNN